MGGTNSRLSYGHSQRIEAARPAGEEAREVLQRDLSAGLDFS